MANAAKTKGLGRGLSSLMGEAMPVMETKKLVAAVETVVATSVVASMVEAAQRTLPVSQLKAGKYQPRRHFDDEALAELADSIEKHGIMQPIVVRKLAANSYEIIAGERRFRAAKLTKLTEVPVIIRDVNDELALELALIENIQRADLNPLEEAAGYQRLMDEFGYTQEKLAPVVGKSRSHIANLLRLQKLPDSIKQRIDSGELTMGHARAILMSKNPEELAQQIVEIGLSVRQAEERAKGITHLVTPQAIEAAITKEKSSASRGSKAGKSDDVQQLETMLAESLGLPVSINTRSGQSGEVMISYDSLTQLDEILRRLGGGM